MKRFFLLLLLCCSLPIATMAKSPKDSYYFQRAVEAMESGDDETAIRYLSEELDQHPSNGYAHTMVAYICYELDSYGNTLEYAQKALKHLPKSEHTMRAVTYRLLGQLYLMAKDTARTISYMELAQKEMPREEENYNWLIRQCEQRGDKEGIMRYAQLFLKNAPKMPEAHMAMARAYCLREQYEEALRYCDQAIRLSEPKSEERGYAHIIRTKVLLRAKRPHEALADMMQATRIGTWSETDELMTQLSDTIAPALIDSLIALQEEQPDKILWPICLFDTYRQQHDYEKAIETGFAILPKLNHPSIVYTTAGMLEHYMGDPELAERMLLKQLKTDSTSAGTYMRLLELYAETGRYTEAFRMADQALTYDPTDFQKAAAYRLRGRTHQLRHEYDEAIEDFMVSMIADPVDKEFWFRIGMLYGLQGDTAKQAAAFEQGRQAYAAQGEELPATAYIAMGDTLAAYEAARTMVKDERDPEDQYNWACILAQTGHHEEAISTLRRSLECGFSNFYHIAWDPDLDSLRELPEFVALINEFKQLAEQRKQRLHERIDTDLNY